MSTLLLFEMYVANTINSEKNLDTTEPLTRFAALILPRCTQP